MLSFGDPCPIRLQTQSIHKVSHLQSKEFDPDSDSECEEQESPPQPKITTLPVSTCFLKLQNVTFLIEKNKM